MSQVHQRPPRATKTCQGYQIQNWKLESTQCCKSHMSMWAGQVGGTVAKRHRIELKKCSVSKHQRRYRQKLDMRDAKSKTIFEQLDAGVIEPSTS